MDSLQVDYEVLEEIITRFRHQGEDTFMLLRRLRQMVHDLQEDGWIGLGSQAFYTEMEYEVLPAVQKLAEALDDSGMTVQRLIDLFEQAEIEAGDAIQTGR